MRKNYEDVFPKIFKNGCLKSEHIYIFSSSALLLSFSGMCILFLFFIVFLYCIFFVFFFCSRWSFVDVPLIFFCPAEYKDIESCDFIVLIV